MSVVHDALVNIDVKEKRNQNNEVNESNGSQKGLFVFDLPNEILHDFYDLREYIRIASLKGQMRVLSIASSIRGEGSSTIATYLAFLMAGRQNEKKQKSPSNESQPIIKVTEASLHEEEKTDQVFTDDMQTLLQRENNYETLASFKETSNSYPANESNGNGKLKFDAQTDILLVDTNLHEPSLHSSFGLGQDNGLADIIQCNLDWTKVVKSVKGTNLKLITAGKAKINPTELLGSNNFRSLLMNWRKHFRYVIFDSPPVLSYVDSLSLASYADGVVLVVRAGQTRWEVAQDAKRKLVSARANLLGVALNRNRMSIPEGQYKRLV